ncbi:bifunctional folylpolyglutamate synthase/dihydrofolate synthase [Salinicola halophilus]|uniref:bifunctional folylpolyglutamate synthase/dihydrofolate synthase n=1 Tax=Salinicola halophilus TaxID=184065 RepID=UPI000DA1DDDD|nr:folylpolyglutamate synthase/dihydrofolate synthase family protein [Salinicola halophilus]
MIHDDSETSTLDDWLSRLEHQHPVAIELGLERVARVAERLGLTASALGGRVVTVAGTNGKGSTVAMIERLARTHGLSTAAYTSPHLIRYNERLRFDGESADDATLIDGFARVEAARLDGEPVSLTYFEAGTLAAMVGMAQRRADIAILEVGLGGRLDAVNVIDTDVAVITTIAHDHADFLGDDLDGIGHEKAGILRAARPAVLGSRVLPASVGERLEALACSSYWLGRSFDHRLGDDGRWSWWGANASGMEERANPVETGGSRYEFDSLPDPGLPLDNAAAALQALALCGVALDPAAAVTAFASVSLTGRLQWRGQWCLDVAHNHHAASYVADRLASRPHPPRRIALIGVLADKDADALVTALMPVVDAWVAVGLTGPRGRSGEALAECLGERGITPEAVCDSPAAGVQWLLPRLTDGEEVLVCGSFHTVGEALVGLGDAS